MGHYYAQDGSPAYFTNGKDTTLREARKLGLVPSTTQVLGIIAKPQLVRWQVNQGILAALTLPRQEGWDEKKYLAAIAEDSKRQAQEAADRGSYIHDQLERDRNGQSVDDWCKPSCERVRELLSASFPGVDDWVAEKSFAHTSGYGGKVDLHSPSTGIVADFKTKGGDFSDGKRLAYDQHYQLASYQQGLMLPLAPCANIFVSRDTQGAAVIHVWDEVKIAEGMEVFNSALTLWKALKKFDPSFSNTKDSAHLP